MKAKGTERTERQGVAIAAGRFESLGFAYRSQEENDYGVDGHAELIISEQPTGQLLGVQVKTGASYFADQADDVIIFRTDKEHVDYWLNHALPIIICLCDVDTQSIYWQAVTKETAVSTGEGYKFEIPFGQALDDSSLPKLTDMLSPVVAADRFTIFGTDDVSHGLAKRYSFRVVVNGTASKTEIASIVRQVTVDGAKRRYHRNHMVEGRWGDADAHVVWTFVYPSAADEARDNYICRSQWIHESLDSDFRPSLMSGENIGNDIVVDWSEQYRSLAHRTSTNSLTKEDYLNTVIPQIDELEQLLERIGARLISLKDGDISEKKFLVDTDADRKRTDVICMSQVDTSFAPFECKNMDECLISFSACIHNIVIVYSDDYRDIRTETNRVQVAMQQYSSAKDHLAGLRYELKKVR